MKIIPSTAFAAILLTATLQGALIPEVRILLDKQDFAGAVKLIEAQRAGGAWTPELLQAQSWLGRGALAAKQYDRAIEYSAETRKLIMAALKSRKLDAEDRLPIALGATIEVKGQALAAKGELGDALAFLEKEARTYRMTSMRARIQKNINLLTLVGKPAPVLEVNDYVGRVAPPLLSKLKGKPVLLLFWAHWCPDCKTAVPMIADLAARYSSKGLTIIAPTQHYGYVAGGDEAPPAVEKAYIGKIYEQYYSSIPGMTMPLSEENFRVYGSSTTPTFVLIDKAGIVRLYRPGSLTKEQLTAQIERLL